MEDLSDAIPNFVFFRGVYPKSEEEITRALLESKFNVNKPRKPLYDKLPKEFVLEDWPRTTNNRCYYDGSPFKGVPVPIPMKKKGKVIRREEGVCCSFACAYLSIITSDKNTWARKENLMNLYNTIHKCNYHTFPNQLQKKEKINYFGGQVDLIRWRAENELLIQNEIE
tara:strand:+ start:10378 stop:10884 length:507 start_codon:yes stop_codon:yes gene_type:complete